MRVVRGGQEPPLAAPQHEARQAAAHEGAGVDIDPVLAILGQIADRVAVHHDPAGQRHLAAQKIVADPHHVGRALSFERNTRSHAGMDEEVVADHHIWLKAFEEGFMSRGQGRREAGLGRRQFGLSGPRHDKKTFGGLALDDELAKRGADPRGGLQVIDLRSGDAVHWLRLEGMVSELYDVVALPGVVRPMALGFKTDEIHRLLTVGEAGML